MIYSTEKMDVNRKNRKFFRSQFYSFSNFIVGFEFIEWEHCVVAPQLSRNLLVSNCNFIC